MISNYIHLPLAPIGELLTGAKASSIDTHFILIDNVFKVDGTSTTSEQWIHLLTHNAGYIRVASVDKVLAGDPDMLWGDIPSREKAPKFFYYTVVDRVMPECVGGEYLERGAVTRVDTLFTGMPFNAIASLIPPSLTRSQINVDDTVMPMAVARQRKYAFSIRKGMDKKYRSFELECTALPAGRTLCSHFNAFKKVVDFYDVVVISGYPASRGLLSGRFEVTSISEGDIVALRSVITDATIPRIHSDLVFGIPELSILLEKGEISNG